MILAALALGSVLAVAQAPATPDSLAVTLLGTGTPQPRIDRLGPATLVEAGSHRLLFDAGRGVPIRLMEAHVPPGEVTTVFLTHLHSDHTTGLPDLWLTGWLPPFGGRSSSLQVIGPRGTRALVQGLTAAFAEDLRMRVLEERLPATGAQLTAREFSSDTVVYNDGGVRVESFEVDHGGELRPAYGYRISYRGRTVVISGDTRYSANLVGKAQGADLLIHEVAMAPSEIADQPPIRFILSHHTTPAEVARVFALTRPRLAVLTHFALPPDPRTGVTVSPEAVLSSVQRGYGGRVVAGQDLMRITVADSITVSTRDR